MASARSTVVGRAPDTVRIHRRRRGAISGQRNSSWPLPFSWECNEDSNMNDDNNLDEESQAKNSNGLDATLPSLREYHYLEQEHPVLPTDSDTSIYHPFGNWIKQLHHKAQRHRIIGMSKECEGQCSTFMDDDAHAFINHKKSSSTTSTGLIEAVKSVSISLTSMSVTPRSQATMGVSRKNSSKIRAHRRTDSHPRASEDSVLPVMIHNDDKKVAVRALQRRRILQELINSEESYLADIKFLNNVYGTFLASIPTLSLTLRGSIVRNISDIIRLHEEILGDLHLTVPHSEYPPSDIEAIIPRITVGHRRWHSIESLSEDKRSRIPEFSADPNVAGAVARIFGSKIHRFFAYEEYGAKYEIMVKDVASCYKTWPQWEHYQKGLETLAASLASFDSQNLNDRKSLTIGDLLVKPMQRTCRYPLLFDQLLKQTPVYDDPESHAEIDKVLSRLRETTAEINRATDRSETKAVSERTWLLQDRLVHPQNPDELYLNRVLGHVQLCGVLYIAWQTKQSAKGQYMISLLYRDCLILATAERTRQMYNIQAKINLSDARTELIDNGRGLQCHNVLFAWKLVFDCNCQLYEVILSACSSKEEHEWKTRLDSRVRKDSSGFPDYTFLSSLFHDIRSLGVVFGKPDTIARRTSIKRAMTIGAKTPPYQILIRNTVAQKSISDTHPPILVSRARSLQAMNKMQIFCPSRSERIRLEHLLSDVWTKEILPFPSMSGRRSEHLGRASERAHNVIRKLSVSNFASNFAIKRHIGMNHKSPPVASPEDPSPLVFESVISEPQSTPNDDIDEYEDALQFLPLDEAPSRCNLEPTTTCAPPIPVTACPKALFNKMDECSETTPKPKLRHINISTSSIADRLKTLKLKTSWYFPSERPDVPLRTDSSNTIRKSKTDHKSLQVSEKRSLSDVYKNENRNRLTLDFGSMSTDTVHKNDVLHEHEMHQAASKSRLERWTRADANLNTLKRLLK